MRTADTENYVKKLKIANRAILLLICIFVVSAYPLYKSVTTSFHKKIDRETYNKLNEYQNVETSSEKELFLKNELIRVSGTVVLSLYRISLLAGIAIELIIFISIGFFVLVFFLLAIYL